jgi:hypothetical protein
VSIESMKREVELFGVAGALRSTTLRLMNRACAFRVLDVLAIEQADPKFTKLDARYEHGFLDADTLGRFARDPVYDLPPAALDALLAKGDRCYGILEGDTLASYGWYSTKPTAIGGDLVLRFDRWYVYMYKGFTHPAHRGKRLHAMGMTLALTRLRAEGVAGIVSYVDATNLSSLRSCYRMGYRDIGTICLAKVGARWLIGTSGGCAHYGVAVEPAGVGSSPPAQAPGSISTGTEMARSSVAPSCTRA